MPPQLPDFSDQADNPDISRTPPGSDWKSYDRRLTESRFVQLDHRVDGIEKQVASILGIATSIRWIASALLVAASPTGLNSIRQMTHPDTVVIERPSQPQQSRPLP
jgi:hypothetical protein